MKIYKLTLLIFLLLGLFEVNNALANEHLQSKINNIKEGGTLHLKKGVYHEEIVLKKVITIEGEKGVIFQSCSSEPMIVIKGTNVHLKGIKIESCKQDSSPYTMHVSGSNHRLEDIVIQTTNMGIKMENVEHSHLKNIAISGSNISNGIDLWEAHQNLFEENVIEHVQDGFYLENSHQNLIIGNTIRESRYGIHVMYSNDSIIKDNLSTRNYTGAMIMGTSNTFIESNTLTEQNTNVNAQGLLLYDVHDSTITNNVISKNRVGLYMEDSSGNSVLSNQFIANFVGTQLKSIQQNQIENNTFLSNVNEIQAKDGTENTIQQNYWDAAWKLDTDGDGKSNLPYQADPYFLNLTKEVPEYQIFFHHPGMLLLQKMLKSPEHLLVTDNSPLMKSELNFNNQTKNNTILWSMSLVMIFSSLLFIYIGRKTR
jgi:nitrous oxidase accessory protein